MRGGFPLLPSTVSVFEEGTQRQVLSTSAIALGQPSPLGLHRFRLARSPKTSIDTFEQLLAPLDINGSSHLGKMLQ